MMLGVEIIKQFFFEGAEDIEVMFQRGQFLRRWLSKVFVGNDESGDCSQKVDSFEGVFAPASFVESATIAGAVDEGSEQPEFCGAVLKVFEHVLSRCQLSFHACMIARAFCLRNK